MPLINYLTTIRFDFGAVGALPDDIAALGLQNPLLVTDKGLVALGVAGRIAALMPKAAKTPVYDGTPSNPTEEATEEAAAVYKKFGCDGIVALGGGSPMDLAKAVAILVTHGGTLRDYVLILGGGPKITEKVAPVIAIPTTAGTGSEVGRGAVMSFRDGRKLTVISPHLIPKRAICDPELTIQLPPGLTAATGMDALTHGIECFISNVENPPAGAIALECARLAARSIETAYNTGTNRKARYDMMMASMMGAMAFQKGLGAVHALAHTLGGMKEVHLHHGTLNAVLLPAVLRFNADIRGELYARLAHEMGVPSGQTLDQFIEALNARIGMPKSLGEMGVKREWFARIAELSLEDHCTKTNAKTPTAADYHAILEAAY
ncbi:MAG: 4-hydroxybutyrate dehydrogenase [Rhizobiales bacterium PAR1]|nr:MAG: 4-hydroxybutyrate dehydrogenase [Rhizobiales bacterium PAR1]